MIEDFVKWVELGGGVLALDWRVYCSGDLDTEQNPDFPDENNVLVDLPSGMMVRLHKLRMGS